MHDMEEIIEENFPHENREKPGRSTGPRSPDGKARSSMNRLTHGCRSAKTILPDEDPAEFEFTVQSWTTAYNPQDPTAATLVFETARAQWIFQRNQHRLDEIESRLPQDAWHWTDTHLKLYNNFSRYKTTAERSFFRCFNTLEAHYKRQADRAAQAEKARAQIAKIHMQWLKKEAEEAALDLCAKQWVEVTTNSHGESITTYAPTNEQLAAYAVNAAKPPEFLTRFVLFSSGVPPAYEWVYPNDMQRYTRTLGIQQFTWSGWLRQIEAEKVAGTGLLQPYTTGLLGD